MQAVLLRVGVDKGSGGIYGPLFRGGSFEFVPIPDKFRKVGVNVQTYGNTVGRHRRKLIEYFPERRRLILQDTPIHSDPEFETFTYGDPASLKGRLRNLQKGDLLVFYAGLQGWDFHAEPALYIIGYFEVAKAGIATTFSRQELDKDFGKNFHVRHKAVFEDQKDRLVLVKGCEGSRLLKKAQPISVIGKDRGGNALNVLSPRAQKVFSNFGGRIGLHMSPPRWVPSEFVRKAAAFVRDLS